MREGWLEETPDGRVLDWFTGIEQRWDFDMGQWVAVPEPTEGVKVFIASNPDGTFQDLGGVAGLTFSKRDLYGEDDDFGGETISTLKTDTFRVTFEGWPEPTYPQLTERQMSPSVYTPQPEDPLFTSEEIEKAAQHVGVRDIERAYGVVVEQGLAGVKKAIAKARDEYETSTEGKKLSKKERIAELEAQVEAVENDNLELDRISNFEHDRAIAAEVKLDQQLEINHTLKTRITNQRTELRRLNESLRTKSLEAKMLGLRVKILGKEKGHLVGSSESKQRTIESQQEIIDGLRAQLAKKSWWRS